MNLSTVFVMTCTAYINHLTIKSPNVIIHIISVKSNDQQSRYNVVIGVDLVEGGGNDVFKSYLRKKHPRRYTNAIFKYNCWTSLPLRFNIQGSQKIMRFECFGSKQILHIQFIDNFNWLVYIFVCLFYQMITVLLPNLSNS